MAKNCRIGMSTTPYERIAYWKQEEGHTEGVVLENNLTYEEALAREAALAAAHGCYSKPGGAYKSGRVWSIYKVSGGSAPD